MVTVTSAGARLILPDAGVTLTIPEGALKVGQVQEFYLAVLREDRYRPKISGKAESYMSCVTPLFSPFSFTLDNQTLLSPLLLCGPSGLAFKKPAILSFQHSASLKHGQWNMSVHYSDSAPEDPPAWKVRQWFR